MKKTFNIKLLQFIMYGKITIVVLLSLLILLATTTKADAGFLYGIKNGLQNQIGTLSPENIAGYLGQMFFMALLPIATIVSLRKKSYKGVIIFLILQLGNAHKNPLHLMMILVVLIGILASKKTKHYFAYRNLG
ncbi:MAG: hypothetical protein N4A57_15005 [Anaeromicrobium sp.]|jgi:hypothetical protein|uniref:hypothetical protein n=1 Tax=Anaeromicrobium sp. TaxID=1929132 RepID=UPI0025F1405F|nr:hypothetical protein [Anaeromicrobium sp.]MCT4595555.1 hypothetical protein [Anaeromicrobium sp.]